MWLTLGADFFARGVDTSCRFVYIEGMETATSTHKITNTEGRTIGWATEQRHGLSLVTDNGIDLLAHATDLADAQAILLEHRHQTTH